MSPPNTLSQSIRELVRACFSGIWIQSYEHPDAIAELASLCRDEDWRIAVWDIDGGLRNATGSPVDIEAADPLSAVRSLSGMADDQTASLLVLQNFHRFLGSPEIVQAVIRAIEDGKLRRTFVVILSPIDQRPIELQKLLVSVPHRLPDREQLRGIAAGVATEPGELPGDGVFSAVLDAASGLTRAEAESAFSLSLVRHGTLSPEGIWDLKSRAIGQSGLLHLHRGGEGFDSIGGLASLKAFTRRALRHREGTDPMVRPRGILLLSPPGCGKSAFCKTLGSEVGRPVLTLDVGCLLGSLVGQSEERTRQALEIVDAAAPCVLMIDEVEKAFAGAAAGGHDSGVASRMFGTFLTWLSDHQSDVFVVCTANDIQRLPPEFSRAERFDGVFFLDLPDRQEKDEIWRMYRQRFGIAKSETHPPDDDWTGAEIRSCCRLASLLDLPLGQAATHVVPIAVTSRDQVQRLRHWAGGRCLSASQPGIYQDAASGSPQRRRQLTPPGTAVNSPPSVN